MASAAVSVIFFALPRKLPKPFFALSMVWSFTSFARVNVPCTSSLRTHSCTALPMVSQSRCAAAKCSLKLVTNMP